MSERWGGFSSEDKKRIREEADGKCDISGDRNNNIVHHITGCYVGRLAGMPEELISNADYNASMLSDEMAEMHDREEDYERACLEYEVKGGTIYEGKEYRNNAWSSRILHNTRGARRFARQKEQQLRKRKRPTKQSKTGRKSHGGFSHTGYHRKTY